MIFWSDKNGRIVQAARLDSALSPMDDDQAFTRTQGGEVADIALCYVRDGQVQAMPPRPSAYHDFDYAAQAWALDADKAWAAVRRRRDGLLADSDWIALRAGDIGQPTPPEWLAYRQALRDITNHADPLAIVWPAAPQ
jgi:hypothetical protein